MQVDPFQNAACRIWDLFPVHLFFSVHQDIANLISTSPTLQQPARLLDIGSSTGRLATLLTGRGYHLFRLDQNQTLLAALREKTHKNANSDAQPLANNTFDAALCCFVLHTLCEPDRLAVLDLAFRVTPVLIVADYCLTERNLHYPGGLLALMLERCIGRPHYRGYTTFMRQGGLRGLLHRISGESWFEIRDEIPLYGGVGTALVLCSKSG